MDGNVPICRYTILPTIFRYYQKYHINYQWMYLKSGCISLSIIYSFEMSNYVKEKQNEQLLWEN